MAHRFGFVDDEGELRGIISPGDNNQYTHLEKYSGQTCVIIPESFDNPDIMVTGWYDLAAETWKTRSAPSATYQKWKSGEWTLDSPTLFQEIREERDSLLIASDWRVMSDSPLSDSKKAEWVTYRQALRDVPSVNANVTTFASVSWPTVPS
jgi:hypothetical protein